MNESCSLEDFSCGTGLTGGSIPKPNDPDNFGTISAEGLVGGIRVRWSFPLVNAHAVAHIKVFRGSTASPQDATEVATVNGNFYEDWFKGPVRTYFYWIQYVSVQGTYHDRLGPASATSFDKTEDLLETLHGQINSGVLAEELRKEIGLIQLNKLGITQEMIERAKSDDALGVAFNEIKAFTENTRALVQDETLARASADEAFVSTVNTLYAELGDNIAAVQNERLARITATDALAKNIETTQTVLGNNISSVQTTMESKIQMVDGKLVSIGALYTAKLSVNGLIGGFGVYNDGRTIEAGFDVDRFWIGSAYRKYKPFVIDGSNIYLNGRVQFSNVLDGPPADADKTGENTAYDTSRVAGTSAGTVKSWAEAGANSAGKVNNWTRPGTTVIDGNKIFTGDAYVDTLQIKGNAITIPVASYVSGATSIGTGWSTICSVWINPEGGQTQIIGSFTYDITCGALTGDGSWLEARIIEAGSVIWESQQVAYSTRASRSVSEEGTTFGYFPDKGVCTIALLRPSANGSRDFYIQVRKGGDTSNASVSRRFISATGIKR